MGCCGGKARAAATKPLGATRAAPTMMAAMAAVKSDGVLLLYSGARQGDFAITGGVTRTKYHVPGPGGIVELMGTRTQGVNPADVKWFLSVNQGRDFRVVERPPASAPAPAMAAPPPPAPQPVTEEAWVPEVMEADEVPAMVPDIQGMTVPEIRELELEPDMAAALRGQELTGKNRKSVLEFLEGIG